MIDVGRNSNLILPRDGKGLIIENGKAKEYAPRLVLK
jgi:hypothetical protein